MSGGDRHGQCDLGAAPSDGLSHVKGATDGASSTRIISGLLADTAARHGDREAVVFREQGVRWSWRQFAAEVDRLAAGLHALGLRRGDRIGIWLPNRVEWLVTQFATARIGLILVNINPAYRLAELEYALRLSGVAALVIAAEGLRGADYLAMLQAVAPKLPALESSSAWARAGTRDAPLHRRAGTGRRR